jgi:hypothetical protein
MDGAGSSVLSLIAGVRRPHVSMKDVRRRPVKEQEVVWGRGKQDRSVNVQDEAPSEASIEEKPSLKCVLRGLVEFSTISHGSTSGILMIQEKYRLPVDRQRGNE